jgi:hypothetical protein
LSVGLHFSEAGSIGGEEIKVALGNGNHAGSDTGFVMLCGSTIGCGQAATGVTVAHPANDMNSSIATSIVSSVTIVRNMGDIGDLLRQHVRLRLGDSR